MALENVGTVCWWVAPTNSATFLAWETLKELLGDVATSKSETYKRLILPNHSEIWCKSAEEPENLRGEGVYDMTIDEAAHVRNLGYVWRAVLRPMLIDSGGSMVALSTPNRRNEFYHWFQRGRDELETAWQSWNFPTTANPHLPPAEFDELINEYPPGSELYRQEILGEFLESGGAVFRKIRDAIHEPEHAPLEGVEYVAGVDWGRANDFTVNLIMNKATGSVVAQDRFNIVDYPVQRQRIITRWDYWGVKTAVVEINSIGEPNYHDLIRDPRVVAMQMNIVPFQTTAQSKRPLIEGLAQAFELGAIGIMDDTTLISELESYERKASATTGASTYSAPTGMHDDCVMALALAWYAMQGIGAAGIDWV